MENYQNIVNLNWIKVTNLNTLEVFYIPDVENNGSFSLQNTTVSNAITASYALSGGNSTDTGSLLTTASFDLKNIIFTKGDGSSFSINLQSLAVDSASYATTAITASYAATASYVLNAVSSSFARTSSYVTNLNQAVTIGNITSTPSVENTLNIYPPLAGGTGEGGQILLAASGGLYTSASMLDTYQNQFRLLKGSNSNQTIGSGTWADRDIIFNTYSSNNFTYNSTTGIATLKAGKTYRITSRLAWAAAAVYTLQFRIYNQTTSAFTGPTAEIIQSTNGTNNISDSTLEHIFAVGASDVDISIRTTSATNALTGEYIRGDLNTQLIIQQIA
jgi:hypothetical protein